MGLVIVLLIAAAIVWWWLAHRDGPPLPVGYSGPSSIVTARAEEYPAADSTLYFGQSTAGASQEHHEQQEGEVRAVWLSYLDLEPMLTGKSQEEFTKNCGEAMDNMKQMGINTVIAQVRPFCDALYPSQYFPWSAYCTGVQGVSPGYDPLEILVREAHSRGLKLEAWVNPFRVRAANNSKPLSQQNPAGQWLEASDDAAVEYQGAIYLNPGRQKARELIINGIREIADNYEVDGIHFDDYFYPSPDESFDAAAYSDYQDGGGELTLAQWRRQNVGELVHGVHEALAQCERKILFGVSPQGNMKNNLNSQYIDIQAWIDAGDIDYLCPQIYYGFENESAPYQTVVQEFSSMVRDSGVKLYVGLAPYKLGQEDKWAGEDGKEEWKTSQSLLARQIQAAREQTGYGGFALFRYGSLFTPGEQVSGQVQSEIQAMKQLF